MVDRSQMQQVLEERFGISSFRGAQKEVIEEVLSGRSAFTVMPTGTGKSLCYQLPAFINSGLTLVVSPLIALMKDQIDSARKTGLYCTYINSSQTPAERRKAYRELSEGKYKMVLVTPERFRKTEFLQSLKQNEISLFAIDEAHCISQWGHDFRPDYSRLGEIRTELGNPVTLALTATATQEVQDDILKTLKIPSESSFIGSMERPELILNVDDIFGLQSKIQKIVLYRHHYPGSCIIYCSLVSTLQKVSFELRKLGLKHGQYHGQMSAHQRRSEQERFIKGIDQLIIATPAFGLGVNKSDVRSVIHAEVPGSVEAYYQEVGRAGRDGQDANCFLLFDKDDITIHMDFIKWSSPDPHFIRSVYNLIKDNPLQYQQEGTDYLREKLNFYNRKDFRAETSVNLLERWGALAPEKVKRHIVIDDLDEVYLDQELHEKKIRAQNKKLLDILQWADGDQCRKQQVYRYFGQESEACGQCDICTGSSE